MAKFVNKICPVCRAPFTEDADVVVCPVCGTPHHRTCYLSAGKCALDELHESGYVWNGRLPDEPEPESEPQPENTDPHHAEYPDVPRIADDEDEDFENDDDGDDDSLDPENELHIRRFAGIINSFEIGEGGVSMRELMAYAAIGVFHYGSAFGAFRGAFDGRKRKVYFNVFSGLFAPFYQFYRRMDAFGTAVLLLLMLPHLAYTLISMFSGAGANFDPVYLLLDFISIAEIVVLCLFGDYIYYKHAIKRITKIRGEFKGQEKSDEYFMELVRRGRPSVARAVIGMLAYAFVWVCIRAFPYIINQS